MKKQIKWNIRSGAAATVTISIDKHERTFHDDFMGEIKKEAAASEWTIRYDAHVAGHGDVNGGWQHPLTTNNVPQGFAGQIGHLGFTTEILEKIRAAVAEIEASEDWKKHVAAKADAEKADREYYEHQQKMKKAMGE